MLFGREYESQPRFVAFRPDRLMGYLLVRSKIFPPYFVIVWFGTGAGHEGKLIPRIATGFHQIAMASIEMCIPKSKSLITAM